MLLTRKNLAILICLILLIIGTAALFIFRKPAPTQPPVTMDSTDTIPSDASAIAQKYFVARESAVDATRATPHDWAQDVKTIVTPSFYETISKDDPNNIADFNIAHAAHLSVQTTVSGCRWNIESGSHTSTQGPIDCTVQNTTIDQTSHKALPFESLPIGWSHAGVRIAEVDIIKQNGKWLVNDDTSFDTQPTQPSRYDINFQGTDNLTNIGITSFQLQAMEQGFFTFAPSVQTVTINAKSMSNVSRDDTTGEFSMTFNVTLDNHPNYRASIVYSGLSTLRLVLNNPQGAQVFDSGDIDGSTLPTNYAPAT
jgi:hypothetical protein